MIPTDDQQVLARRGVPPRRIIVHAAVAHVHIGNVIWLVFAGWWLALGHLMTAVVLAVTIIGIPFAWAHLKLAGLALWPIGKVIVPAEEAQFGDARAPRNTR
jgi:uncharacterized membrane protein YccF (DUF307 family)